MSRTVKQTPPPGKAFWKSRLHRHGEQPGKFTKIRTHRKERQLGKSIERIEIQAANDELDDLFYNQCDDWCDDWWSDNWIDYPPMSDADADDQAVWCVCTALGRAEYARTAFNNWKLMKPMVRDAVATMALLADDDKSIHYIVRHLLKKSKWPWPDDMKRDRLYEPDPNDRIEGLRFSTLIDYDWHLDF